MAEVETGQVWEMYSPSENRWVRVIVTSTDGAKAKLRYEGVIEFLTVDLSDMQDKPDRFRRVEIDSVS